MKITKTLLASSLMIMALPACSRKPPSCIPDSGLDALKSMVISSAEVDAAHGYASGDRRLIGIHSGVGLIVPELIGDPDSSPYKIKIFEISDVSCGIEEHEVKNSFAKYAGIYNKKMISLLKLNGS